MFSPKLDKPFGEKTKQKAQNKKLESNLCKPHECTIFSNLIFLGDPGQQHIYVQNLVLS